MSEHGERGTDRPAEGADLEVASEMLAELTALSFEADRIMARVASLAGELTGQGAVEQLEGMPLEQVLILQARMRGTDARFTVTMGEVLADMPVLAGLYSDAKVSTSVVRQIVWSVRAFGAAKRWEVDQRLAATIVDFGGLDVFDPDRLIDAVHAAVQEARHPSAAKRSEARRRRQNFLQVQADLDGGITGFFSYDAITGAIITNALDAAADAIAKAQAEAKGERDDAAAKGEGDGAQADQPADASEEDDGVPAWERATARGRQLAVGLERLARYFLSGGRDGSGGAKPLVVVHVDTRDVHVNRAGTITLNVRGALPTITMAALEALSVDADMRTVLFDGARPLAVSKKLSLRNPSADTRLAVAARDLADRWPGSRDPIGWTDLDHMTARTDRGTHHPDNLVSLTRRHHVQKHDHGWTLTLDGDTGALTITRRGKSFTSLPPGTPLPRPPDTRPPDRPKRSGPSHPTPGSPPPTRRTNPTPAPTADTQPHHAQPGDGQPHDGPPTHDELPF